MNIEATLSDLHFAGEALAQSISRNRSDRGRRRSKVASRPRLTYIWGGMRSVGRRFCYFLQVSLTRRALCLLALITLTLLFASPEQVHGHSTTQPGLYNADCPFAAIAARDGQASLPSSPLAVSTACAARLIAIVAQTDLSTRVPLHSEFRAPPLS